MFQFHGVIRDRTRADHDLVDTLFGAFDLTSSPSYTAMLRAHARALLPIEDWMKMRNAVPLWSPRGEALCADLRALDALPLVTEPLDWPVDDAAFWGTAYVLEGSRLGGAMLSRRVGAGLPHAYLGHVHEAGGWRRFLAAFGERADEQGLGWQERAIAAAQRAFLAFADAVRREAAAA